MTNFSSNPKINEAVELIFRYGGIDGDHHKQWVLDNVLQILLFESEYDKFVKQYRLDEDGEELYGEWDKGVAP